MVLRHPDHNVLVRSFGLTFSLPRIDPYASKDWHQFVLGGTSPLIVGTSQDRWLVGPDSGLWLPAGEAPYFMNRTETTVRMLYFPKQGILRFIPNEDSCHQLVVTPLLKELIHRVIKLGALVSKRPCDDSIANLIHHELSCADRIDNSLREPKSPRLTALIAKLEKELFRIDAVDKVIGASGYSRRTYERLFLSETQASLGTYVRKRRLLLASELLTQGCTVDQVSFQLGYANSSAFIQAFKSEFKITPGAYARSPW